MEAFAQLERLLRAFRWSLLQVALVETLALCSLCALLLVGAAVWACAAFPDAGPVRAVFWTLGGVVGLALFADAGLKAFRLFRDPVGVVARLRLAYPEVGPGLETVVRLLPALKGRDSPPPFSEALLVAEAERNVARLGRLPPRPPADLARTRRLVMGTAGVVAALIGVTVARPADVARGVRRLTGIEGPLLPAWMSLPEEEVDLLTYDVRTTWIVSHPDGSTSRVPAGEAADILAPAGVAVEVSGNLTAPALRGHAIIGWDGQTFEVPLVLAAEDRFEFILPEVRDGVWTIRVVTTAGATLRERSQRRIVRIEASAPRVAVEPEGLVLLKPGGTATISYEVESRVGVARVVAVVRFPFAPARPPVRVTLREPAPGEHLVRGEIPFAWPDDPTEYAGRADLEIEAVDWLGRGAGDKSPGPRVRFVLDTSLARRLAEIEEADDLVGAMARALDEADIVTSKTEAASSPAHPPGRFRPLEASGGSGDEWSALVARARKALATVTTRQTSGRVFHEDARALESAILELDAAVRREWASFLLLRLADLEREAARWRSLPGGGARPDSAWAQDLKESLLRASQTLAVLQGLEQRGLRRAEPASTGPVTAYRRAEAGTKAREAVAAALDFVSSGSDKTRLAEVLRRCFDAVARVGQVYRGSLSRVERVAFREIVVSPEVSMAVKRVIEAQREVHDRTAQMAFEWKQRAEATASGPAPDGREMTSWVEEAERRLARVPVERLGPRDAAEVVRAREDLKAISDLIDAPDFVSALEQARALLDRVTRLAADLGDEGDWLAEERPEEASLLSGAARNLRQAARPLRELTKVLAAWKARAEAPPTPAMRAEAAEVVEGQNRVISALDKAVEPLGSRSGAWAEEVVGMATSARRNMTEAAARLSEARPWAAEVHQRQAVQDLLRLKRALDRGPFETGRRPAREEDPVPVTVPVRPGPPADELREEIRRYQGEPPIPGTEELVRSYYQSLFK